MSDDTPGDKKPKPIFNPDDVVEPAVDMSATRRPPTPRPTSGRRCRAVEEPVAESRSRRRSRRPSEGRRRRRRRIRQPPPARSHPPPTPPPTPHFAGREVVYVQAPIPPRLQGNRGVGSLLAVLGAVVFAALYAGRRDRRVRPRAATAPWTFADVHPERRVLDPGAGLPGRVRAAGADRQPRRLGRARLRQPAGGARRLLRVDRHRCCSSRRSSVPRSGGAVRRSPASPCSRSSSSPRSSPARSRSGSAWPSRPAVAA